MSGFFNLGRYVVGKAIKALPRSKKVSPDIKSVKPTKLSVKESLKKTKSDEYYKRIKKLDEGRKKVEEGKKMMKEGQKIRKGMKDTGTAFQFKSSKSYHAIEPGDAKKYKIKKGIAGGK
jgi:hypothetical protein